MFTTTDHKQILLNGAFMHLDGADVIVNGIYESSSKSMGYSSLGDPLLAAKGAESPSGRRATYASLIISQCFNSLTFSSNKPQSFENGAERSGAKPLPKK